MSIGAPVTRRRLLVWGLGLAAAPACGRPEAVALPAIVAETVEVVPGLRIHPRRTWGADLAPAGPLAPEDVRFLLVHHTAGSNRVTDVAATIRSIFHFHTGPAKRWPDVAYHFFVAPDGGIWEGRSGSIDGPVVADATGGNQGFAQLVCLIGDHRQRRPTAAAQESTVALLAWLRWRYRLPADPDATTTFVSRGSNRHPAGTPVTTPVVAGHRDHTFTECPGDTAYSLLPAWRLAVADHPDPAFPDDGPLRGARRLDVTDFGANDRAPGATGP